MILFFYIFRQFFKYVLGTILLCLFLFILFDFIHKTTAYFGKYNSAPILILQYYIYQLPFQIMQAIPLAALLASVIVMVIMNRSQEIAAMRAFGMSPIRIAMPLLAAGVGLSLLVLFLGEVVVPRTAKKMRYVTQVLIEGEQELGMGEMAHWFRRGAQTFHYKRYDPQAQILHGLQLIDIGPNFNPQRSINAARARFIPKHELWRLEEVQVYEYSPDGLLSNTVGYPYSVSALPVSPKKLVVERRAPDEMALRELSENIAIGARNGASTLGLRIAWHTKCAYPLAALIMSLIGLQFGYRSERAAETLKSILVAFAVGLSYWFILSAARAMGFSGDLHPFLAGWIADLFLGVVVSVQIWKLRYV